MYAAFFSSSVQAWPLLDPAVVRGSRAAAQRQACEQPEAGPAESRPCQDPVPPNFTRVRRLTLCVPVVRRVVSSSGNAPPLRYPLCVRFWG